MSCSENSTFLVIHVYETIFLQNEINCNFLISIKDLHISVGWGSQKITLEANRLFTTKCRMFWKVTQFPKSIANVFCFSPPNRIEIVIYLVSQHHPAHFLMRFASDFLSAVLRESLVNILLNIFINLHISKYICTIPGNAEFHSSSVSIWYKMPLSMMLFLTLPWHT